MVCDAFAAVGSRTRFSCNTLPHHLVICRVRQGAWCWTALARRDFLRREARSACAPITGSMPLFTRNSISRPAVIGAPVVGVYRVRQVMEVHPSFLERTRRVYRRRKGKSWKDQFRVGRRRIGRPRECRARKRKADVNVVHVADRGTSAALTDLFGAMCTSRATIYRVPSKPSQRTGQRLGVGSPTRFDVLSDVPVVWKPSPEFERQPCWHRCLQGIGHSLIDKLSAEVNAGLLRRPNSQNGSGKKRRYGAR